MPGWMRWIVVGLALALVLTLAGAPPAATQEDAPARIDVPANGASVTGTVEVRGRAVTADPSRFSFYRLYYGAGTAPSSLRPIGSAGEQPVENGVLGVWDTAPLFQGEYLLQLTVYDSAGDTTTAQVVVNVLPAPTPTLLNQPSFVVVPDQTPTPTEEDANAEPTATPLPELPQLDPQIPYIEVPQQPQAPPPPIQHVDPPPPAPGFQPIPIDPGAPSSLPPPPLPGPPAQDSAPSFDPGTGNPPPPAPFNPVNPVGPPPAPVIAPYEPPPTLAQPPTPTLFGQP